MVEKISIIPLWYVSNGLKHWCFFNHPAIQQYKVSIIYIGYYAPIYGIFGRDIDISFPGMYLFMNEKSAIFGAWKAKEKTQKCMKTGKWTAEIVK